MPILGKVAMTSKGEWSDTVTYEELDLVTKTESTQASLYIAAKDIPAGTALTDEKWRKLYTVKNGTNGTPGAKGDTGTAATISVGTVTSGATASVKNSGTASAATLDFVLPKGDKGDKGETGSKGADGKYVTAIALTKDDTGAITGGTATMSDKTTVDITVATAE